MKYAIGVDIGGTKISVVLGDMRGKIRDKVVLKTQTGRLAPKSIQEVCDAIEGLLRKHRIKHALVAGIGVGCPGFVDVANGVLISSPNLPGWAGFNLRSVFADHFGCPVYCHNDANATALGEKMFGCGKDAHSFAYVTLSTGIGSGVIVNNVLVTGASNCAGELGHVPVELRGPVCGCGKTGCLEALSSGTAIAKMAQDILSKKSAIAQYKSEYAFTRYKKDRPGFILKKSNRLLQFAGEDVYNVDSRFVAKAAKEGDELSQYIIWRAGYYFGVGLASFIQVLNPQMVALGGSVTKIGKPYFDAMKTGLAEHAWKSSLNACTITKAKLGNDVADYGTLSLVLQYGKRTK